MNAYELADELHEDLQWIVTSNTDLPSRLVSAINMLRQQADRIAELEKDLHMVQRHYDQLDTQTKPLSDEEIMDIAEQSDYSPVEIEMGYDYEIRIARAIEERHGIK